MFINSNFSKRTGNDHRHDEIIYYCVMRTQFKIKNVVVGGQMAWPTGLTKGRLRKLEKSLWTGHTLVHRLLTQTPFCVTFRWASNHPPYILWIHSTRVSPFTSVLRWFALPQINTMRNLRRGQNDFFFTTLLLKINNFVLSEKTVLSWQRVIWLMPFSCWIFCVYLLYLVLY